MDDILMTNIFFMITAIASVVLTIVVVIALVYIIKLVKKITQISDVVEEETRRVITDVEEVRVFAKQHLNLVKGVAGATVIKKIVEKIFKRNNNKE